MALETIVEEHERGNHIITGSDGKLFRGLGWVGSLTAKLMLLSYKMGETPKEETKQYITETLNNSELKNTTVRIGHTRTFQDTYRLFKDPRLRDVSLLGKIIFGIPSTLFGGLYGKLFRGDHYNPFTRTIHCYSDVKAIAGHELGHAVDYQQRKHPLTYGWFGANFDIIGWYQEYKASKIAAQTLSKEDRWQDSRYLLPAYLSYIAGPVATIAASAVTAVYTRAIRAVNYMKKAFSKSRDYSPRPIPQPA